MLLLSACADRRRDPAVAAVSALSAAVHPYASAKALLRTLSKESQQWLFQEVLRGQGDPQEEHAALPEEEHSADTLSEAQLRRLEEHILLLSGWQFELPAGRQPGRIKEAREGFRLVEARFGDRSWLVDHN